ncbi:MAG: glycoside hydrolase family 18 protein, partial [Candidatus Sumerlaeia bacterium]|nr:glycoside hydrolase family 18 protein [Candidatus Sumerlaeia bacterium]
MKNTIERLIFAACLLLPMGLVAQHAQFPQELLTPPSEWEAEAAPKPRTDSPKNSRLLADSRDFITWGYLQNQGALPGAKFQALTDITSLFVNFDSSGNLTNPNTFLNRDSNLRPGGAAEGYGTRVHVLVANSGFNTAVTEAVLNSPANRANLIAELVDLITTERTGINAPGYVHGISFDFEEFNWSATTAQNMALFFPELREALDEIDPELMITWYVDPSPSATQFSTLPQFIDSIDYIIYSQYDFGTGTRPRAISDIDSSFTFQNAYLTSYGVPPEKFIVATSTYGRIYQGTTQYGVAGTASSSTGIGFTDGLFATTLQTPPLEEQYVTGDETAWYTDGNFTYVAPGIRGLDYHTRQVMSYGGGGTFAGRKFAGVAFWSMMWLTETSSYERINPIGGVSQTRTYPHFYEIMQIALGPKGNEEYRIEGFEGFNARWEDPDQSPATTDDPESDSSRSWELAPGGPGRPEPTMNALRLDARINTAPSTIFFRHELFNHHLFTDVLDRHAAVGHLDSSSVLIAFVHAGTGSFPEALPGVRVSMVVLDAQGEVERSPFVELTESGWQKLEWDLSGTPGEEIIGAEALEPGFLAGDGIIPNSPLGSRDIAFLGFLIQSSNSDPFTIYLDEVTVRHQLGGNEWYVINELRFQNDSSEFVEIFGTAGEIPGGLTFRLLNGQGNAAFQLPLTGTIADRGDGFGYYVLGEPGVPNVQNTNNNQGVPFTFAGSLLGFQLLNTTHETVYDSVVTGAHGGIGRLIASETYGVADEGWPWLPNPGKGVGGTGTNRGMITLGRLPDGADTNINNADFSHMPPTPGAPNGVPEVELLELDFETPVPALFSAEQTLQLVNPTTFGVPSAGGNALRVVDTVVGGLQNYVGDAQLGSTRG